MDKNIKNYINKKHFTIMIHEFIMGAYPYIIIGLAIAAVAAVYGSKVARDRAAKGNGKDSAEPMQLGDWLKSNGCFVASMGMYAAGLMMYLGGNSDSSAPITWLCLGSAFLCLGALGLNKQNANPKNDDNEKA